MFIQIRPVRLTDKPIWKVLFDGYLEFYETQLSPEQIELTWKRLLDPTFNSHGLIAEVEGSVLGLTHYSFQNSTWAPENYCYLEDLFTSPDARGKGVGKALIDSVLEIAREAGSSRLYWNTDGTNEVARRLYDTFTQVSGKVQYRIKLD